MGLNDIIYYKAKNFIDKYDRERLKDELRCETLDISLSFLRTFKTIKAHSGFFNTIIDVGAYKGEFSKVALRMFPEAKYIYCFEPNEEKHQTIKENTREDVKIFSCALSNKKGTATFYSHKDPTMNSTVQSDEKIIEELFPWDQADTIQEATVHVRKLDNLVTEKKLNMVSPVLLKLDTQGNELSVLKGAKKSLPKIDVCIIEQMFVKAYKSDYEFYDLVLFMDKQGFKCKGALPPLKRPNGLISSQDFIFVNESSL